jgi:hypothetical protein
LRLPTTNTNQNVSGFNEQVAPNYPNKSGLDVTNKAESALQAQKVIIRDNATNSCIVNIKPKAQNLTAILPPQ